MLVKLNFEEIEKQENKIQIKKQQKYSKIFPEKLKGIVNFFERKK